jgi:hypothetical protein
VSCKHHAPAAYTRGESLRYQLGRRLGGPQSRYGRCGEERNLLLRPGIEPRYQIVACRYTGSLGTDICESYTSPLYKYDQHSESFGIMPKPKSQDGKQNFVLILRPNRRTNNRSLWILTGSRSMNRERWWSGKPVDSYLGGAGSGRDTCYTDWKCSRFSSVLPGRYQDSARLGHDHLLLNPFHLLIYSTNHPAIRETTRNKEGWDEWAGNIHGEMRKAYTILI